MDRFLAPEHGALQFISQRIFKMNSLTFTCPRNDMTMETVFQRAKAKFNGLPEITQPFTGCTKIRSKVCWLLVEILLNMRILKA